MFQSQQQTECKDGRDIYLLLFNTQRSGERVETMWQRSSLSHSAWVSLVAQLAKLPRGWNEVTGRDNLDKTAFIKRRKTKDVINKHN